MKGVYQLTGGLFVVGVGYIAYGPLSKRWSDRDESYTQSQSLLVRRNKHEPMHNKGLTFNNIGFSTWNQTGVEWSSIYHENYFNDEASYQFDQKAIKQIVEATYELHNLCLEAVDDVVKSDELMDLFEIPMHMRDVIKESWNQNQPDLLGRFDFLYDGTNPPKMIEYNADTPTLLVETARAQSAWAKPKNLLHKQFNYITNALRFAWDAILDEDVKEVVFAGQKNNEEWDQLKMLQSTLPPRVASSLYEIKNLFYESRNGSICASPNSDRSSAKEINWLWKLYPWEWFCREEAAGQYFEYGARGTGKLRFGEPAWKMIVSNKALLAYLWQEYPNHPNLLPSYFSDDPFYDDFRTNYENKKKHWVAKPKFGRGGEYILLSSEYDQYDWQSFTEDANKEIQIPIDTNDTISLGKRILQEFYPTPHFNGRRITIGSWVIFGAPAGIGVREDIKDVIYDNSSFVPHYVDQMEPSLALLKKAGFDFYPSTKRHEELRNRLYGEAGEKLLDELYQTRNEYWDADIDSQHTEQGFYRGHGGGGGGGGGFFYNQYAEGKKSDAAVRNKKTFAEKLKDAVNRRAKAGTNIKSASARSASGSVGARMSSTS